MKIPIPKKIAPPYLTAMIQLRNLFTTQTTIKRSCSILCLLMAANAAAVAVPSAGDPDFPHILFQASPALVRRHAEKVKAVQSGKYDLALIGDSITQNMEGFKASWEKYYAPRHAIDLGYSGFRTEDILGNLTNGELDFKVSPKVFMLLIGTNNTDDQHYKTVHTGEGVYDGTKAIVDLIKSRHPTSRILVLHILPCGGPGDTTTAAGVRRVYNRSAQCIEYNRRAGELVEKLADNKQVFFLNIDHVFRRPDGSLNSDLMPDLIHPNEAGADAMAAAIASVLDRLMGNNPGAAPISK